MAIRHYLIIKDNEKEVFKTQIFGNNIFADDEFYKKLKIKNDGYEHTVDEVNFNNFFREWMAYIRRGFGNETLVELGKDLDTFIKKDNLNSFLSICQNYVYLQIFITFKSLSKYINPYKSKELKDKYKMYLEIG